MFVDYNVIVIIVGFFVHVVFVQFETSGRCQSPPPPLARTGALDFTRLPSERLPSLAAGRFLVGDAAPGPDPSAPRSDLSLGLAAPPALLRASGAARPAPASGVDELATPKPAREPGVVAPQLLGSMPKSNDILPRRPHHDFSVTLQLLGGRRKRLATLLHRLHHDFSVALQLLRGRRKRLAMLLHRLHHDFSVALQLLGGRPKRITISPHCLECLHNCGRSDQQQKLERRILHSIRLEPSPINPTAAVPIAF